MRYKFIEDLTSDVMFEAYGKTEKELLENAAEALLSVICEIKRVKPKKPLHIEAVGMDMKELMFNWLQELIALVDTEEMFFSRFDVEEVHENKLRAVIWGEPITPEKSGTLVKGVTKYNFSVKKGKKGFTARVVCDI